ncbi:MAG: tRNA (guanosine(37)-N1)-methyltransferase TrmD [Chloroflexi bacterium]|nr:tRNA (guanosine(37)-N1)-methyltransferase TrmD [Chloroflexota bacterium]
MQVHVLTIFPEMFPGPLGAGIVERAQKAGLLDLNVHNIRDYAHDRHRTTDDTAYGGGPGMVMRPEPLFEAVESLDRPAGSPVVLLTPQGKLFTQREAERLSKEQTVTFICGRYEGVDERVRQHLATEELSIGDYVLTGGEIATMVIVEAVARLLPGALGHGDEALLDDTHTSRLVQYPQYTRPSDFQGAQVPDVLLTGDHAAIAKWRRRQSLQRTLERRPDLLKDAELSPEDRKVLQELGWTD